MRHSDDRDFRAEKYTTLFLGGTLFGRLVPSHGILRMISLLSITPYSEVRTTLDQQRGPDSRTWTKCPPAPISCRTLGEEVGHIRRLRTSYYLSELSSRPIQGSGGTGLFWLSVIIQVPPLQISEDGHDGGPHPPPSVFVRGKLSEASDTGRAGPGHCHPLSVCFLTTVPACTQS